MQKLPLKYLSPGMKIAKPVANDKGIVLCGEGTMVNSSILSALHKREIPYVYVDGHPVDLPELNEPPLEERIQMLGHRFRKIADQPEARKLKDEIAAYWTRLEEEKEMDSEEESV